MRALLGIDVIGTLITALCCFTPILVMILGIVGLSALTGYLDYVLLSALGAFILLTLYALWRRKSRTLPPTPESPIHDS